MIGWTYCKNTPPLMNDSVFKETSQNKDISANKLDYNTTEVALKTNQPITASFWSLITDSVNMNL